MNIIDLAEKRPSVHYTINIEHKWDGSLSIFVHDLEEDERSKKALAWTLYCSALSFGVNPTDPACQECESLKHDLEGYMDANKALINKEWVVLTDDEALQIYIDDPAIASHKDPHLIKYARAIEQSLKVKNHG
jgi:hypothetical protein